MENSATTIRFAIILAQFFGMFPISNVYKTDVERWDYKWSSWISIYTWLYLIFSFINTIFQFCKMVLESQFALSDFVTLLFFLATVVTVGLFIDLARKWKRLMQKWLEVDHQMSISYEYPPHLKRNLVIVTIVVMFCAACEHGLFLASIQQGMRKDSRGIIFEEEYFQIRFGHVFMFIPYNTFLGVIVNLLNVFSTFSWNYMDLFIMLIGKMIGTRFEQLTMRIQALFKMRAKDVKLWYRIREDFVRLKQLCRCIDFVMSNIIFLSFCNNLFVVLIQLFNSLKRISVDNVVDKIYYTYSFAFLIIRTIAVALYGSSPHSECLKSARLLHSTSSEIYNEEIRRLIVDIQTDPPALSGNKIFLLTKPLILHIAATIVTYELIIVQFNP